MRWKHTIIALSMAVLLVGCAETKQPYNVQTSGFLGDLYPKMREGNEDKGEGLLVYRNPKYVNNKEKFRSYDKILLDPVMAYRGKESRMSGVTAEDAQSIVNHFYNLISRELSKDYEMVDRPGSGTMRLQVALTKLEESNVALDVVSNVPVYGIRAASKLTEKVRGKAPFVGEAVIEARLIDSSTSEVIGAGIDRRVGGLTLSAESFDSWADVYGALELWAKGMRWRFCKGRGDSGCVRPEA